MGVREVMNKREMGRLGVKGGSRGKYGEETDGGQMGGWWGDG